ncbi:hypothetical protein BO70DRAFT_329065 [Aspergillus heteromorphus CBS 117.55]|uniref:Haloacid dehalogenase-like hydrolase n=1 Tax=Aspergillus heteromorphus CBS 117.55 TaxID=1448321 RepID=A0A317X041_9EURO|nr:uncharacterized protein BO70DRAFT_329065 [Aspergillus heteromorphus CBS 117.55]PWY90942.1 hypothetical protein BO70DRAFT_329065 [Aspergillus heteromorphus CBS 117.55]
MSQIPIPTPNRTRTPKRTLLLTLDAFNTLFHPRTPIPEQYVAVAHAHGLPRSITPSRLLPAFKSAFKAQSLRRPNYGRADVLRGAYGGPREWWADVIRGCFTRVLLQGRTSGGGWSGGFVGGRGGIVSSALVESLLERFAGREGYALYSDVRPFFDALRARMRGGGGGFDRVVVGVVSNSDDRVAGVLGSLGVRVGPGRAGDDRLRVGGLRGLFVIGILVMVLDYDIDLVITSYEAGEEKPSPVIFDVAEQQARRLVGDLEGEWERVHVGDDYEKDYRGALGAGWKGCFLQREGGDAREGTVRSLREVVDMLGGR